MFASDQVAGGVRQYTVLVVEDDSGIRETLKLALELDGFTVFAAAHGQEAIEALAKMPKPCVILLDLMMPVMDGYEFAARLERNPSLASVPIVVVTAFPEKADSIASKAVLKKPVELETLSRTVKQWCGDPNAT